MAVFLGKFSKDGTLNFGGNYNALRIRDYAKKNPGKSFRLEDDTRSTAELIRFFEIVNQYFFYQHEQGAFENFQESREALKLYANPRSGRDIHGKQIIVGGSMAEVYGSKKRTIEVLEKIEHLFADQGYEYPDSKAYSEWLLTFPEAKEIYPPLEVLINTYKGHITKTYPWRS